MPSASKEPQLAVGLFLSICGLVSFLGDGLVPILSRLIPSEIGAVLPAVAVIAGALGISKVWIKTLGENNPTVGMAKSNLAKTYGAAGKNKDAEELSLECLKSFEAMFAVEHPYVANCKAALADVYIAEGKLDEAGLMSEDALM